MKKTLGELIEPGFSHYRSIGELARTLQFLMSTAHTFRDPGRWGTSGPQEYLCAYGGCVNCDTQPWHSGRIVSTNPHVVETTTWQQNQDSIRDCILDALCSRYPAELRWRKRHKISLDTLLKFPMAYQNQDNEKKVWEQPMGLGLGGTFVPCVEPILFCRRGNLPAKRRMDRNWWGWPRGRHSQKPEAFQTMVESVSPGPYLEMFARRKREGWAAWGNEITSDLKMQNIGAEARDL
jgi:hypothetical protein